ncbi:MAG TPA: hypothetical protein VGF79_14950 [Bacteroidia bacterium]
MKTGTIWIMALAGIMTIAATSASKPKPCGKYNGHQLYKGDKGGCFYLKTKKKVKVYVDKKNCNC